MSQIGSNCLPVGIPQCLFELHRRCLCLLDSLSKGIPLHKIFFIMSMSFLSKLISKLCKCRCFAPDFFFILGLYRKTTNTVATLNSQGIKAANLTIITEYVRPEVQRCFGNVLLNSP